VQHVRQMVQYSHQLLATKKIYRSTWAHWKKRKDNFLVQLQRSKKCCNSKTIWQINLPIDNKEGS
jgi:hypothetical protein